MNYNKKLRAAADRELERRRHTAESIQRQNREEVLKKLPRIGELERELAGTGAEIVKIIAAGGNVKKSIDKLSKENLKVQEERKNLLVSGGYPEDYLEVKYTCPKCKDTGFVEGRRCDCYREILRALAYKELCGNAPLDKSGFDNFKLSYYPDTRDGATGVVPKKKMAEILTFCKSYAEDFDTASPSLLMYGATGLGKTHLSLAIASEAVKKGFGVIYGSAQNLLIKLEKERFGRSGEGEAEEALLGCDLLVIDDLGAEFATQFTVAAMYNIINTRLLSGLPTIISTNLSPEELEEKYTQRITSRIIGNYICLPFCGKDIRQIKK
ncbi:MAG: ATP-binding protein [Clostridiales bacterium]|nr:ATP-binding protein [Clostridiales bacterium]